MKNILLVAPNFDEATEISFDIYDAAKKKLNAKINLEGNSANRENFEKGLKDISLIGFWDHGNKNALIGNDRLPLVDAENVHLLKGKEIFTVACLSSKEIGRYAVKNEGIPIWQGYNKPIIVTSQLPFFNNFEEPLNMGIIERKSGTPIWLCHLRQKRSFKKNIKDCQKKGGTFFASLLAHNLKSLDYLRPNCLSKIRG